MRPKTSKLLLSGSIVFLLSILASSLGFRSVTPSVAQAALQTSSFNIFLPLMLNSASPAILPTQTVFGVEMSTITAEGGLNQLSAASTTWVRRNAVLWSDVESSQGTRNWSALAGLENELLSAGSNGIRPILIVRSTPLWARKVSDSSCGPIAPGALGAFGNFMHDLVARYSVPPYNVKYWEIWNEPDAPVMAGDNVYGCWGNPGDQYFGGEYYGQMLQAVYPRIKAADPTAQVLVGGLLLDCNPSLPGACTHIEPPRFLEGILHANDGASFDGVSFHAYDYYQYPGVLGHYGSPNWNSYWNTTGPAMIAKATFLRGILTDHGVTGKFLMNTESALLCESCTDDPTYETTKAYYVAQVYAASIAQGLRANIWFNVFGWRNSGLLNLDFSPRPAYTAYQFARSELRDASFSRDITDFTGVKGYEFNRGGQKIWILWSLDGNSHSISLPAVPLAAWDAMGSAVPITDPMILDLKPIYLEMP